MNALQRLAQSAGLETAYHDIFGNYHQVDPNIQARVLSRMGFAVGDDAEIELSAHELENRTWLALLQPVYVLNEEQDLLVEVVASGDIDSLIGWRIEEETGLQHSGELPLSRLTVLEQKEIDGVQFKRYQLPLPGYLPLGYHQLQLALSGEQGQRASSTIIVTPPRCYGVEDACPGQKPWGVAAQLYSLRDQHNWGMGDYSDIAHLARSAASKGASLLGLNPLHARVLRAVPAPRAVYAMRSTLKIDERALHMSLLEVDKLSVEFTTNDGLVHAVNDVSFSMAAGSTLAIVGESGSGKSQTAFSILGLLAKNGTASGSVRFNGREILNLPLHELNRLRAAEIAMIFQDPMTSLNPYMRVSEQMSEVLIHHKGMSKRTALKESVHMLDAVKIPDAQARIRLYPHEFSGGMRQRVMIAMSLLCKPKLLIADEPTTALDVTVQAQTMALLREIQTDIGMGVILITHDLGVVAGFCQNVLVLYGGRVMEKGPVDDIYESPSHPYTQGLLQAIPRVDQINDSLTMIPGSPPDMMNPPAGCPFEPRCQYASEQCKRELSLLRHFDNNRQRACHRSLEEIQ